MPTTVVSMLFMGVVYLAAGALAFAGFAICMEWRWVRRLEYRDRLERRCWDAYWPIGIPADLDDPLY